VTTEDLEHGGVRVEHGPVQRHEHDADEVGIGQAPQRQGRPAHRVGGAGHLQARRSRLRERAGVVRHRTAGALQHGDGIRHGAAAHEQVVGVVGGDGEDADAGRRERRGQLRQHADDLEWDRTLHAEQLVAALGLDPSGTDASAQMIDSSSAVRVMERNSLPEAHGGRDEPAGSRHTASRTGSTVSRRLLALTTVSCRASSLLIIDTPATRPRTPRTPLR
jgi:hypothetical protein